MSEKKIGKSRKVLLVIRNVVLGLLGLILLSVLVIFIAHKCMSASEKSRLESEGYINPVSVGDYNLNVYSYGNKDGKHKIVGISGLGMLNTSVTFKGVTDTVSKDNEIIIIDRAGYGFSDDTSKDMTTETIVEDYRTALKNAGYKAPYVLMAHSIGGAYATYWESKYPDEIEGVLFLDGSQLSEDMDFEIETGPMDYVLSALCKTGLQRVFYDMYDPLAYYEMNESQAEYTKMFIMNSVGSSGVISESTLANENGRTAYKSIVKNDIPKTYISASYPTEELAKKGLEYMSKIQVENGGEPIDTTNKEGIANLVKASKEFDEKTIKPYLEKMGNCEEVYAPGTHLVYLSNTEQVADELQKLLIRIEK